PFLPRCMLLDVIDGILYCDNFLSILVRNLYTKLFLEGHYQLDSIQIVRAEVFGKRSAGSDFPLIHTELLDHDPLDALFDGAFGWSHRTGSSESASLLDSTIRGSLRMSRPLTAASPEATTARRMTFRSGHLGSRRRSGNHDRRRYGFRSFVKHEKSRRRQESHHKARYELFHLSSSVAHLASPHAHFGVRRERVLTLAGVFHFVHGRASNRNRVYLPVPYLPPNPLPSLHHGSQTRP